MSRNSTDRPELDADMIASKNPTIDFVHLKEWRKKMAPIERLGLGSDGPRGSHHRDGAPSVPNGQGLHRTGNLPHRA